MLNYFSSLFDVSCAFLHHKLLVSNRKLHLVQCNFISPYPGLSFPAWHFFRFAWGLICEIRELFSGRLLHGPDFCMVHYYFIICRTYQECLVLFQISERGLLSAPWNLKSQLDKKFSLEVIASCKQESTSCRFANIYVVFHIIFTARKIPSHLTEGRLWGIWTKKGWR